MSSGILRSIRLTFQQGSSNKEYNLRLSAYDDGRHFVAAEYGAIGRNLKTEYKNKEPITLLEAQKLFDKIVNEKVRKGYVAEMEVSTVDSQTLAPPREPIVAKTATGLLPMLLNPIERTDISHYQHNANWCFQIKYDGERQLIKINESSIVLANRRGLEISPPESVIALAKSLAESGIKSVILDCERMTDSQFVVFDILKVNDDDLINTSMFKRLIRLNNLSGIFASCLSGQEFTITKAAFSTDEKHALLKQAEADNEEGIVIKHMESGYTAGRPASLGNALKLKFYDTATVRVLSHHKTKSSVGIEMMDSTGNWVAVGNVTIPANASTPAVGSLIEVRYLYAYMQGSLYQPTYLRARTDLADSAAWLGQLKYKKTEIAA